MRRREPPGPGTLFWDPPFSWSYRWMECPCSPRSGVAGNTGGSTPAVGGVTSVAGSGERGLETGEIRQVTIGYIRVSTVAQADEGVSLDAQRDRIVMWCKANGYTLNDVFCDAGVSGKRADNREGLQRALNEACWHRGSALIVYSLSRLARSAKDAIGIAERPDDAGADLVSLSEKIDTTSAAGKMVFRMLAVLAEFERDLVSERTTAALAHKRRNGQRVGTNPFGHVLADDGSTLLDLLLEEIEVILQPLGVFGG